MAYNTIQYQAHTEPVLNGSVNLEPNWHEPWSDPKQTIAKKAIVGAFIALIASGPFAPVLTQDQLQGNSEARWHQPWSTPLRVSVNYQQHLIAAQQPLEFHTLVPLDEVITYDKWGFQWSEPIRLDLRKNLRAAEQQFLAFQLDQSQQPEQVTESRWHQPWSEPVRFKIDPKRAIALAASGPFNPPYASEIEPGTNYTPWFAPLSEPVRFKPGLGARFQQFHSNGTVPPDASNTPSWYAPLSDPVRIKPRLIEGRQQFLVETLRPPLVSFAYYNWLSEPVRTRNLRVALQRFFDSPPRVIPNPIFMTMNALETNTDQMQASVYIANAAGGRTRVSIIEIRVPLNNPISIRES